MLEGFVKWNRLELLGLSGDLARHGKEISFRTDFEEPDPHTGETILRIP